MGFVPCRKCNNGYIYDEQDEIVRKCSCLIDYQYYSKMEIRLKKAGIPYNYIKDYSIRQYVGRKSIEEVKKLKKFINKFDERFSDKVLYLWGPMRTQKTTLSYWVGRELLMKGKTVKYVLMNDLVKDIQNEQFDDDIDTSSYYNTDCLIIDRAFDSSQVTLYKSGYQIPFLDNFLRKRIDQFQKCTLFVSNISVDDIAKNGFGKDIEDLIKRKVLSYDGVLEFRDYYTQKDDFDTINLWED